LTPAASRSHADNQTVVKERIYLDKVDSNVLHDEVTTIDNALTRPWTVTKNYHRERKAVWVEAICAEGNQPCPDRDRKLYAERRRLFDAGQEGSGPAGLAIFQADPEVTTAGERRDCRSKAQK
jgi:hypothetical protein